MTVILEFRNQRDEAVPVRAQPSEPRPCGPAQVIIFPGVQIVRDAEAGQTGSSAEKLSAGTGAAAHAGGTDCVDD